MYSTRFPNKDQLAGVAVGYTTIDGELTPNAEFLPWRGMSAGGGVSTAGDLLRFVDALQSGRLLSKAMFAEAIKQQTPWYGYGFISSGPANKPHWGHGGGAEGMSLALAIYPMTGTVAVCMANRDPPVADRLLINYHYRMPNNAGSVGEHENAR
jgi:D-alanyl-D-alanine carboxypeptidase